MADDSPQPPPSALSGRTARLTLADVLDLREYERRRDEIRSAVIATKRRRRVSLGPHMSVVFENRDTVWFQVHEMVRAERMLTDDAVQGELDAYNPLIPAPGELSATVFLELVGEEELRYWLGRLVGIEKSLRIVIGDEAGDGDASVVVGVPEESHEAALTREEVTASVHYVRFCFEPDQVLRFEAEPVTLVVDHPEYRYSALLGAGVKAELFADLTAGG